MSTPDYKEICRRHLISLRYALAADSESTELLAKLDARCHAINWNDPFFIELSEVMRAPLPPVTPEQEKELQPRLVEIIHSLIDDKDKTIQEIEDFTTEIQEGTPTQKLLMKRIVELAEQQKRDDTLLEKLGAKVESIVEMHAKMKDRLEMLGDDTSEFEIHSDESPE